MNTTHTKIMLALIAAAIAFISGFGLGQDDGRERGRQQVIQGCEVSHQLEPGIVCLNVRALVPQTIA